jgi:Tetratricopeptide repeat
VGRHAELDAARSAEAEPVILALLVLSVVTGGPLPLQPASPSTAQRLKQQESPQGGPIDSCRISQIRKLYQEEKWEEVLQAAPENPGASPEIDLYRALALAKLQRWNEARAALEAGARKSPKNERFPVELAGVAYKQKDFRVAERELRRALRLAPHDSYALNFLATIYFLRGNLDAALKYWNREKLPRVEEIKSSPVPQLRAGIFDGAFAFAPLSTLQWGEFETTQARLDNMGIFALYRWELSPRQDASSKSTAEGAPASFDVIFHAVERDGFGPNKWTAALSILRGLPYETVYPEYDNAFHEAVNFSSLLRFDSNKERIYAAVSAPVQGRPRWRASAWIDGRNERWNVSRSFFGASSPISGLKLRKVEAGARFRSVQSGRWNWETSVLFARRDFAVENGESLTALSPRAAAFFTNGNSLELTARTHCRLFEIPEERITADASADGAFGRFFAAPLGAYGRTGGALAFRWLPNEQGDDYETRSGLRMGGTFGAVPFDELFTLGVERDDNELWLRGISATQDGRKGNSPMGRDFVLWNSEMDKVVYRGALFQVRVGPLFDVGRIWDASGLFGSQGWLWDPGAQVKVRVLDTFEVVFSYGHDMRSGQNTFFGGTER